MSLGGALCGQLPFPAHYLEFSVSPALHQTPPVLSVPRAETCHQPTSHSPSAYSNVEIGTRSAGLLVCSGFMFRGWEWRTEWSQQVGQSEDHFPETRAWC